jgi:hypothetical protein
MRVALAAMTIVLLTAPGFAQGSKGGLGVNEQQQQVEQRKRKATEAEKAYQSGLEKIPDAGKKSDPWGDLRGADTGKSGTKSK